MTLYPTSKFGKDVLYPRDTDFKIININKTLGKGVITYRSFKKGETLAKMTGEIISDIRQHTLQINKHEHLYDPYFSGYFLHSCDPNISLDMQQLTVVALKDIQANSLLYMDYAETEDYLFAQFSCCCGTPQCRGWITGRLQTPIAQPAGYLDCELVVQN
jgi:hypothetical protein